MPVHDRTVRNEVEHAEQILDRAEQQIGDLIHRVVQTTRSGVGRIGQIPHSSLRHSRALGRQAQRPVHLVARQIRRDESPRIINVNRASAEDLMTISGIGPVLAQRIIDQRNQVGPFGSLDDLYKVSGLSHDVIESARDKLSFDDTAMNTGEESE